jgi:hypothetical protein
VSNPLARLGPAEPAELNLMKRGALRTAIVRARIMRATGIFLDEAGLVRAAMAYARAMRSRKEPCEHLPYQSVDTTKRIVATIKQTPMKMPAARGNGSWSRWSQFIERKTHEPPIGRAVNKFNRKALTATEARLGSP